MTTSPVTKTCTGCGTVKPLSDFYNHKRSKFGVRAQCKACDAAVNKKWRLEHQEQLSTAVYQWRKDNPDKVRASEHRSGLKKHGLTVDQYDEMLKAQHGACAICGGTNQDGKRLAIDHDHSCCPGVYSCGRCVRGLLCKHCNYGIGHFRDSQQLLAAALEYVRAATVGG